MNARYLVAVISMSIAGCGGLDSESPESMDVDPMVAQTAQDAVVEPMASDIMLRADTWFKGDGFGGQRTGCTNVDAFMNDRASSAIVVGSAHLFRDRDCQNLACKVFGKVPNLHGLGCGDMVSSYYLF